jgi:hypothetical protein
LRQPPIVSEAESDAPETHIDESGIIGGVGESCTRLEERASDCETDTQVKIGSSRGSNCYGRLKSKGEARKTPEFRKQTIALIGRDTIENRRWGGETHTRGIH